MTHRDQTFTNNASIFVALTSQTERVGHFLWEFACGKKGGHGTNKSISIFVGAILRDDKIHLRTSHTCGGI